MYYISMSPIEYLYYLGYRVDRSLKTSRRRRLYARTVSVGNITLGGAGKTPLVISLVTEAVKRGLRSCILTRGYRGRAKDSALVSIGNGPLIRWEAAGDEPYYMATRLKGVWIVKDRNRYRGSLVAGGMDIFILDDGYQHWQLERDMDILVIDANRPFGNNRLLPLGRLREPLDAMERADIILINHSREKRADLESDIRRYNTSARIFYSYYHPSGLVTPGGQSLSLARVEGKKVLAFSGIGSPENFLKTLRGIGLGIAGHVPFRDHHLYSGEDFDMILRRADRAGAEVILTTEKDLVKIRKHAESRDCPPLYALRVDLEIFDEKFYDIIFEDPGGSDD